MIRKLLSICTIIFAAAALCSCSESQETTCDKIAKAFEKGNDTEAADLCARLYADLPHCSMKTLGDLTVSYFTLSVIHSTKADDDSTYEAMSRMVKCYDAAMKQDPTAAKAMWKHMAEESMNHGQTFDVPMIADAFRTQLQLHEILDNKAPE